MNLDAVIISNIKKWLDKTKTQQKDLAAMLDISPAYLNQILKGERNLQRKLIPRIVTVTGLTLDQLTEGKQENNGKLTYSLRGSISNAEGKRKQEQLILDVQHFVQLLESK